MIKEVLQTKVTNFKTIQALVQHIKPKINNLINMGFDEHHINKPLLIVGIVSSQ